MKRVLKIAVPLLSLDPGAVLETHLETVLRGLAAGPSPFPEHLP